MVEGKSRRVGLSQHLLWREASHPWNICIGKEIHNDNTIDVSYIVCSFFCVIFSQQHSPNLYPSTRSPTNIPYPLRRVTKFTLRVDESVTSVDHLILMRTQTSTPLTSLMYPLPPLPWILKMLLILTITTYMSCPETQKQI